jgi:broad specificity phosphatase PhoE
VPASNPIVLLVRHGRTELNDPKAPRLRAWENPPLNRLGQLDAQMAGQELKRFKPQMVYSSDLSRDSGTAFIIADILGNIPVDTDFAFRTADMGDLAGMLDKDAAPLVERWYDNPWMEAPGGESNNDFLRRWYQAFNSKYDLAQKVPSFRPSVIVTHGRNISAIHARSEMIPQKEASMPLPGGIASVYDDEAGNMKLEFLGATEPVHADA